MYVQDSRRGWLLFHHTSDSRSFVISWDKNLKSYVSAHHHNYQSVASVHPNASSIWASRLVFVIQWKRDIIFLLSKDDCQSRDETNGVSLFQHQGVLIALLLLMAIHLLIQIVRFGVSVRPSEVIKSL